MSSTIDELITDLENARRELEHLEGDPTGLTLEASRHYEGLDLAALRVLRVGVADRWPVPEGDRRKAKKQHSLPYFIQLAEEYAPSAVDRTFLANIAAEYHPRRNALKYRESGASAAHCFEYLEAILSIAYLIQSPSDLTFPVSLLRDFEGFKLRGSFLLKKRLLPNAWTVLHLSKPDVHGDEHILSFFQHLNGQWLCKTKMDLGTWNVATVQLLQSRSPTQEELLVWRRGGESMGVMSYDVLAVENDEVLQLLQREGISGGYVMPKPNALEEHAGGRVTRFVWDGDGYIGSRVIRPPVAKLGGAVLHYAVVDGQVKGPATVRVNIGETLEIARDDFEASVVRTLGTADGVTEWKDGKLFAKSVGETTLTLIPDVYDWAHALKVSVRVSAN